MNTSNKMKAITVVNLAENKLTPRIDSVIIEEIVQMVD